MRYEEMKPDDYKRAKNAAPVAYLPWGAHEWHGRHNPLGLDALKAHALCLELCAETGGVVFPAVYCGHKTMKPYMSYDCTLEFSLDCLKMLAREYLTQLAEEGFRVIVIVMGHYSGEQVQTLKAVAEKFNNSQREAVAWAFPDNEVTHDDGFSGDHAALGETSYMLYFRPELVDLARLPTDRPLSLQEDGITGADPRDAASAKIGHDAANSFVRNAAPRILEMLAAKRNS